MPEYSAIYEDAIDRIQSSYSTCSIPEQKMMRQILEEMSQTGYSYTLEQIYLSDFKELPVGIDQFLNDPYYLGNTNNLGANVYPFWRETFKNIFNAGNRYNEIILSGATRLGKSTSCTTMTAYMLYKLMLYRNPHEYFQKKAVSKFTIGFANLTKELAMSVCYREFNDTLKESPWFCNHGSFTRSDRNFYYIPEGDKIDILPASSGEQLLGKQVWCCLTGETKIITNNGIFSLAELSNSTLHVLQYDCLRKEYQYAEAEVKLTRYVEKTVRIELEDGSVIEGTPDHRVLLSSGSYKRLDELTEEDDIMEV